mgnify:CR=1 FL=1|tara:strand:- start:20 stop:412 length:393 start_codon:yes stop_codon:yes gene_type:complete
MNVKNSDLINAVPALNELLEQKLPVKTAFKLAKLTRIVQPAVDSYNDVLQKLQQEHCEKDEEGNPKIIPTDDPNVNRIVMKDWDTFAAAHQDLLDAETDLGMDALDIEEFGDIDIEGATLFQISWLFKDL